MSEPLVILPAAEVKSLVAEAVAEALGGRSNGSERPLTVKEFASLYNVDCKRVYEWIEQGLPHIKIGDVRGKRIWAEAAKQWLEAHHG